MEVNDKYKRLLIGQLRNENSREEQKELFAWVYSDSCHEKLFYELKDIWNSSKIIQEQHQDKQQEEWAKLWSEIEKLEKKNTKRVGGFLGKSAREIYKIAAILIIAFGASWFILGQIQKSEYNTIVVPYGAKTSISLSDGTQIWLNSGTTLKYPSLINTRDVEVYLEGEAFFDVAHLDNRKFKVKTSTLDIQVLGTRFNVKSYEDEGVVETTLERGEISIRGKVGNKVIEDPIILKPNQQALLTKGNLGIEVGEIGQKRSGREKKENPSTETEIKELSSVVRPHLTISKKVETEIYTAWKDNKLIFKSESFDELTKKMERWYDVNILIHDKELKKSRYTGTFEEESIEQALAALSLSLPFNFEVDKNRIDIYRNKNAK